LTKYTLFHHFKHKKGLVYIENNHFVGSVEEISAIIKKFPRPWVAWVARFSMSGGGDAPNGCKAVVSIVLFLIHSIHPRKFQKIAKFNQPLQ